MALTMARPWRDPKSGIWHLRQRTPSDLKARLKGSTVTLPVGDGFATVRIGEMVQASLRTADKAKAKELHAAADAALRRFWEAQRNGPTRLSQKQAVALAGELYRGLTSGLEDDPGHPETWAGVLATNAKARAGRFGRAEFLIDATDEEREDASTRERYGPLADMMLSREGLTVDEESRERLIDAVANAADHVARKALRNAKGDYSPDVTGQRFPAWEPPANGSEKPLAAAGDAVTVSTLWERWAAYQSDKKARNTVRRYGASFRSLAMFFRDRDVRELTGDDLHAWAEHRRDNEGVGAISINKNDIVAASSVFKWAMKREGGRLLTANPAQGVRVEGPRVVPQRERTFRASEVSAILKAALAVKPDRKNPTFAYAKRWCPWLAAYSGARIAELTHLEARDIRDEGGVPVMDLRQTKTAQPRTVPLHEHLIEQGFLEFVRSRGDGPLFYDPKRHKRAAKTSPAELRAQKVAGWVRKAAKLDKNVDPNHGWRHSWKTTALGAGIPERISDAITGHRVASVARGYEAPPVNMLAEALRRFPRYRTT